MKEKTSRRKISDELWSKIEPLLPVPVNPHPRGGGKKRVPSRKVMSGILFVLKTGCQWKSLDATGICSGSTAHLRFQEWQRAGVFLQFWQKGLLEYDDLHGIDWKWQSMDGAMTKAPLGGEKNGRKPDRSGQKRR